MPRNQHNERSMELPDAVRWTEMMPATKVDQHDKESFALQISIRFVSQKVYFVKPWRQNRTSLRFQSSQPVVRDAP